MRSVVVFPSYGMQIVGNFKEIYDADREIQEYFEDAVACTAHNMIKLCCATAEQEVQKSEYAYAALFMVSTSIGKYINRHLPYVPACYVGYEQASYAALYMAGVISMHDALYLLQKLSVAYYEYKIHNAMVSLSFARIPVAVVQEYCFTVNQQYQFGLVHIAIYYDKTAGIAVGTEFHIDQLASLIDQYRGAKASKLELARYGIYSPQAQEIASAMRRWMEKVDFHVPLLPVLMSGTSDIVKTPENAKQGLLHGLLSEINYVVLLDSIKSYDQVIIAGNSPFLYAMLQKRFPSKRMYMIATYKDMQAIGNL